MRLGRATLDRLETRPVERLDDEPSWERPFNRGTCVVRPRGDPVDDSIDDGRCDQRIVARCPNDDVCVVGDSGLVQPPEDVRLASTGDARSRTLGVSGDDVIRRLCRRGDDHLVDAVARAESADIVCDDVLTGEWEHYFSREPGRSPPGLNDGDDVHAWSAEQAGKNAPVETVFISPPGSLRNSLGSPSC